MDIRPKPIIFRINIADHATVRSLARSAHCSEDAVLEVAIHYFSEKILEAEPRALALQAGLGKPKKGAGISIIF